MPTGMQDVHPLPLHFEDKLLRESDLGHTNLPNQIIAKVTQPCLNATNLFFPLISPHLVPGGVVSDDWCLDQARAGDPFGIIIGLDDKADPLFCHLPDLGKPLPGITGHHRHVNADYTVAGGDESDVATSVLGFDVHTGDDAFHCQGSTLSNRGSLWSTMI